MEFAARKRSAARPVHTCVQTTGRRLANCPRSHIGGERVTPLRALLRNQHEENKSDSRCRRRALLHALRRCFQAKIPKGRCRSAVSEMQPADPGVRWDFYDRSFLK